MSREPVVKNGVVSVPSNYSVAESMNRIEKTIIGMGLNVFARINHAVGAAKIDMPLRPTELILFGSPQGGTPYMQMEQTIGLDLPLKLLAWESESGQVWLSYNDVEYLKQRHHVAGENLPPLNLVIEKLISVALS